MKIRYVAFSMGVWGHSHQEDLTQQLTQNVQKIQYELCEFFRPRHADFYPTSGGKKHTLTKVNV